jgi:hypothetical protein
MAEPQLPDLSGIFMKFHEDSINSASSVPRREFGDSSMNWVLQGRRGTDCQYFYRQENDSEQFVTDPVVIGKCATSCYVRLVGQQRTTKEILFGTRMAGI